MTKILLVEDDASLQRSLGDYLRYEGFDVTLTGTLKDARAATITSYQLLILDWMLPDGQGIDFLRELRHRGHVIPSIVLTARAELIDKVTALELGANDYMTKPFEPRELLARIRVQLRPTQTPSETQALADEWNAGGIRMTVSTREVVFRGEQKQLSKMEFELLKCFLQNPNHVFSREELLNKVWGYDSYPTTRTVDTHILQLRQKFSEDLFETLRGVGYRFLTKI